MRLPSISLQSLREKKEKKNLVIASRLFGKFAISSQWKRTKLTGKEKRERVKEREEEEEEGKRKRGKR